MYVLEPEKNKKRSKKAYLCSQKSILDTEFPSVFSFSLCNHFTCYTSLGIACHIISACDTKQQNTALQRLDLNIDTYEDEKIDR